MMTKFKVGERVKFINNGGYMLRDNQQAGEIVDIRYSKDLYVVKIDNYRTLSFRANELLPETSKPSYPERISLLESQVAELQAKVEALQKVKKPKYTLDELLSKMPTPNEQRKAVIDYAKDFVGRQQALTGRRVEYVVNAEKRTVVALIYRIAFRGERNGLYAKAIAKCAPDDVFNADIGKAIALGRALGLDVSEFENVVKPTEVVVGHIVLRTGDFKSTRGLRTIVAKLADRNAYWTKESDSPTYADYIASITDDTEAQY